MHFGTKNMYPRRGGRLEHEAPAFRPPNAHPLTLGNVSDARISQPAQLSLMRLSKVAATSAAAVTLLQHVKGGRIAGILCSSAAPAAERLRRLGTAARIAIAVGEDAVLLLDPADLQQGPPLIAFRRTLDPACRRSMFDVPVKKAEPARLDAALLKALASFTVWRAGIQLGRSAKCALAPLADASKTVDARRFARLRALNNVLPRLLCQPQALPGTPGTPKQVRHRHVSRKCNSAFAFVDDGPAIDLLPANMNPRFILPDDSVSIHLPLQDKLTHLLVTKYASLLSPESVRTRTAHAADRLRIALVDLTGRKLCQPQFAGFGATVNESGASTAKILLFYAAHQMLIDLREMVRIHGIRTEAALLDKTRDEWSGFTCRPDLKWLFKFTPGSALLTVDKSDALNKVMDDIVHERSSTPRANELLLRLSFEYVASLAWQSGLRHPQRGGIWFGSTYCQKGTPQPVNGACHVKVTAGSGCDVADGQSRLVWKNDPLDIKSIRGSALSFVTYMTLLGQGRLVNAAMSAEIEGILAGACTFVGRAVVAGSRVRATKCGETSVLFHDAALVERLSHRFAVAFMTRGLSNPTERLKVFELVRDLDILIKDNP